MLVSVIICTWNNARRLSVTLDALSSCHVPPNLSWELILVNNNSTDETDHVVEVFAGKLPLRYLHENQQGASFARNAAIHEAGGRLLVLTDDDVTPCKPWLTSYVQAFAERPQGFYFGGPVDSEYESAPPEPHLLPYCPPSVRGLDLGQQSTVLPAPAGFVGANWACPAESIRAVGGFDPRLGLRGAATDARVGEETEMMKRLGEAGLSPYYVAGARVAHFVRADNCKLPHIARRIRDYGYYEGRSLAENYAGSSVLGVPPWVYRDLLQYGAAWVAERLRGGEALHSYLRLQQVAGTLQGFRSLRIPRRPVKA